MRMSVHYFLQIATCMICLFGGGIQAQQEMLAAGPMVSYSEMREAAVWVQLKGPGEVQMAYWPMEDSLRINLSKSITCIDEKGYTGVLIADQVEPGKKYLYNIYVNGQLCSFPYPTEFQTQTLWQWREDPPAFSFAAGSCYYVNEEPYDRPGKPYGGEYEILLNIYNKRPDFMIWLGDNTYLREADWNSRSGYFKRHSHSRALRLLQPLLGSTHHYATWDDHDYGPNDSDRTWKMKQTAKESFELFWPAVQYDVAGTGGITHHFQWADCDFFMMDGRWSKSPNSMAGEVLGRAQLDWLKGSLAESRAPFKFICIGVMFLSTAANKENMSKAGIDERAELIQFIHDQEIEGVIFLTGDRHFSELSLLETKGKVPIYDLTSSPLTSGSASSQYRDEVNQLRVKDTEYYGRNFALLSVAGERKDRVLTMKLVNAQGEEIWTRNVSASEFKVK